MPLPLSGCGPRREESLAYREAQKGNSRLITNEVSDAVAIDEQDEH
jgi:hypothetical protein